MGNIIASCGHRLTRKQSNVVEAVTVRGLDREGRKVIKHVVLCPKCLKLAQSGNCLITSEAEGERWIAGIGGGCVW